MYALHPSARSYPRPRASTPERMTKYTRRTLLIHAEDPIIAALLGALLGEDAHITFPEREEPLEAATGRLNPDVVLVDITLTQPGSPAAEELAKTGVQLIFFGSTGDCERLRLAGSSCFALPAEREGLHAHVRRLVAAAER